MDICFDYAKIRIAFHDAVEQLVTTLTLNRNNIKVTVEQPITIKPFLKTMEIDPFEDNSPIPDWMTNATFRIYHKNDEVTRFSLKDFPFCCGYLVSGFVVVHPNYRHYGIGSMMNKLRCRIAAATGHISLICTVVKGNKAQEKVLMKNGWSIITEGISPKTGNYIQMYAVNLNNFRDVEEIPNLVVQIIDPIYAELLGTLPESG